MAAVDPFRFRTTNGIQISADQNETLVALLDTYIAPLSQQEEDALVKKFAKTHTEEQVRKYCRMTCSEIDTAKYVKLFVNRSIIEEKHGDLTTILSVLSTKAGTFALTGYFALFKDLSREDRERIVINWKNSFLPQLRQIYKTFHALSCFTTYSEFGADSVISEAMKYRVPEIDQEYENQPERLPMIKPEDLQENAVFDVIVIGSGAGGGVVASQLAQAGKNVLVIDKGKYHHEKEFIPRENKGMEALYESAGFASSYEGTISILAASVFGGGTTVNWSASLKLQHFVREEWARQGLTHFISPKFSKDLDKVFERIGASTAGIKHNNSNQILIDGCKKLGYPFADIPQNTHGKPHECNFCYTGCKAGIKNGTMNTWLRDAHAHNAKFMDKTKVKRVIIKNGKAQGVEVLAHYNRKMTIRADKVVVSGGSLQSPGILLRSGLTNKNIGKNLRLHPCTITFGFFDRSIATSEGSIMTAVSGVAENVDTEGYGAKLEVPLVHPGSFSTVMPWRGAVHHKELMLKYDTACPILVLSRDKNSDCTVRYNEHDDYIVDFKLSNHDRQSIVAGMERSLMVLVAAGAREVHTGQFGIEPFAFNDDEESRVDNPRFIEWKNQVVKHGFPQDGAGIFCAHQMASNRMGISPKTSVTKPTGETWEVKNLYVADASVLPTATGVNPMVTTEAVCLHIADCILNDTPSKI
ncbi:long-chain fatty alcohol dehydrogenase [Backusella circina FSU 941]|nr:long-chain fatty alcohol dehydrogenase [Backusella circina FSU 941]